jgi:hypothetical protein
MRVGEVLLRGAVPSLIHIDFGAHMASTVERDYPLTVLSS